MSLYQQPDFLVQYPQVHSTAIIMKWPCSRSMIRCTNSSRLTLQSICNIPVIKRVPVTLAISGTCTRVHFVRAVPGSYEAMEFLDVMAYSHPVYTGSRRDGENETGEVLPGYKSVMAAETSMELEKETMSRNRKIHGNKGRVPPNKGTTHCAETRAVISQRTREALSDPKVRRKMRERKTSDEVKAKIGASQIRRITERNEWKRLTNKVFFKWAESIAEAARKGGTSEEELDWTSKNRVRLAEVGDMRRAKQAKTEQQELLEWEPLTNKVFFSWAESIAEAARKGGMSEEELDWDSYNRMRREVSGELVRYFTIEGNRKRAKTAIEGGAANETEMLVGKKEQEQAAEATSEVNGEMVQGRQNGNFGARESSLRARLAEISGKKSTDGKLVSREEVTVSGHPSLDKIDLQSIEKVITQKKVSLADQIRAAKSKRERSTGDEASATSS